MTKKQLTLVGKRINSYIFICSHILLGTKLYLRNDYSQKLALYLLVRPQNSENGFAKF